MTLKKPSNEEEEYFAREEAEHLHRLAVEISRKLAEADIEARRVLHHMKCPKCGYDLKTVRFRDLAVDKCFHCNGTWLDAGELETLAGSDHSLLDRMASVFKR
jgi:tRNA G26 N,N-dimethylase Trm1